MNNTHPTISIGIPAYNERYTIKPLLISLLGQIQKTIILKEIIIVSDASTDGTEEEIMSLASPLITVIKNEKRLGVAQTINTINKHAEGDILVLLNADILVTDQGLVEKLVNPLVFNNAELVAGNIQNVTPTGLVDQVLAKSSEIKKYIYTQINGGMNVYTCHGPIRAMKRSLYKSLHLVDQIADDMYTYYYAKMKGFRYTYVPEAIVYYKLPTSVGEHVKQSNRFFASLRNVRKEFEKNNLDWSVYEPGMFMNFFIAFLKKYPFYCLMYMGIEGIALIRCMIRREIFSQQWEQISSSKFFYGL